jgi:hypothetical protein
MWNRLISDPALRGLAAVAATAGITSFALLHVLMADIVDPLRQPVSSYALTQPGTTLFATGALGLAAACAILAGIGAPRHTGVRVLLALTSVMFVLVVMFRTDAGTDVSSIGGQVHRYAAGAAFVLLTLVGLWSTRHRSAPTGPAVTWLTVLSALILLVTTLNTFLPDLADGGQWRGLPQRVLLVVQSLLIMVLARRPRRPVQPVVLPMYRSTPPNVGWRVTRRHGIGRTRLATRS